MLSVSAISAHFFGVTLCTALVGAAMSAQRCYDEAVRTSPDSRYVDRGDGLVQDLATGLTWRKCPEGLSGDRCQNGYATTFTWQGALEYARTYIDSTENRWRVPNKKELYSLMEWSCTYPSINTEVFPGTPPAAFWSATPIVDGANHAEAVNFRPGIGANAIKSARLYLRLVLVR
jgi:hypothetical protein